MPRPAAELALPDPHQTKRQFDRAARSFAGASFLHDTGRRRLLERLEAFRLDAGVLVDVGSALGAGAAELSRLFPDSRVVALDFSREMLRRTDSSAGFRVAGDARRLPFPDRSVELLFANLVLPWLEPAQLFAEARRTLSPNGVLVFSTLGPDSLQESRRAWLEADDAVHVHAFWDMHALGDLAVKAGLEEPVLDVDRINVSYRNLSGVIRDLRASGATNLARGRRRGLTGRGRWQRVVEALWQDQGAGQDGRLSITAELIFGQAFGARSATPGAGDEIVVPLDQLGRIQRQPPE